MALGLVIALAPLRRPGSGTDANNAQNAPAANGARSDGQIEMDVVHALDASQALKNDLITAATIQSEVTCPAQCQATRRNSWPNRCGPSVGREQGAQQSASGQSAGLRKTSCAAASECAGRDGSVAGAPPLNNQPYGNPANESQGQQANNQRYGGPAHLWRAGPARS